MTAYIRVAAAATAVAVGAILGLGAHPGNRKPTAVASAAQSLLYAQRVGCTLTWTGRDAVVFTDTPCLAVPGFTTVAGYAPPTGDRRFGVVCALRSGDAFNVIASRGGDDNAGLLCDAIIGKGWSEDPQMGDDFDNVIQESSRAVRA